MSLCSAISMCKANQWVWILADINIFKRILKVFIIVVHYHVCVSYVTAQLVWEMQSHAIWTYLSVLGTRTRSQWRSPTRFLEICFLGHSIITFSRMLISGQSLLNSSRSNNIVAIHYCAFKNDETTSCVWNSIQCCQSLPNVFWMPFSCCLTTSSQWYIVPLWLTFSGPRLWAFHPT